MKPFFGNEFIYEQLGFCDLDFLASRFAQHNDEFRLFGFDDAFAGNEIALNIESINFEIKFLNFISFIALNDIRNLLLFFISTPLKDYFK